MSLVVDADRADWTPGTLAVDSQRPRVSWNRGTLAVEADRERAPAASHGLTVYTQQAMSSPLGNRKRGGRGGQGQGLGQADPARMADLFPGQALPSDADYTAVSNAVNGNGAATLQQFAAVSASWFQQATDVAIKNDTAGFHPNTADATQGLADLHAFYLTVTSPPPPGASPITPAQAAAQLNAAVAELQTIGFTFVHVSTGHWAWILGALLVAGAIGVGIYMYKKRKSPARLSGYGADRSVPYFHRGMTLRAFISDNKADIDAAIKRVCSNCKLNDRERGMWIRNDEGLYRWARSSGVRI